MFTLERFSIAFTANGKRQAEISRLPKTREIYLVLAYVLPVSHSYGASTKNREISYDKIIFLLLQQAAACRLPFDVSRKREAKSLYCGWLHLKSSAVGIGFNEAETNCGIAHILGILLMNSYNTDIICSNYYHF